MDSLGEDTLWATLDVTDTEASDRFFAVCLKHFGRVGALVNNAGVAAPVPALEVDAAPWRHLLALDLEAVFFWAQRVTRAMREQEAGTIVNLALIYDLRTVAGWVAYHATKYGVVDITEALAVEWAPLRIRVNAVAPGYADTDQFWGAQRKDSAQVKRLLARVPVRRLATPEEIASAVLFLVSDEASFITGHTLVVDGVWLANDGPSDGG